MWTYADESLRVVVRVIDGRMESRLVTDSGVSAWIAEGNAPAPAPVADGRPAVLADFRTRRETYLDRLAGIAVFTDDLAVKAAAKVFRQRLLDIPQAPEVLAAPDAGTLELVIVTLYRTAAMEAIAAAPAGKAEFDRIAK